MCICCGEKTTDGRQLLLALTSADTPMRLYVDTKNFSVHYGPVFRCPPRFGGGLNSLIDCVGQSVRSFWHHAGPCSV